MEVKNNLVRKFLPYLITLIFIGLILYLSRNQCYQFGNIIKIRYITVFWLSITFITLQILQGYLLKIFITLFVII